jgi:FG-GAP-like repeat
MGLYYEALAGACVMKTSSFCVTPFALLLILLAFGSALTAASAVAQVSFFTPPGYVDGYPLFTADFNRDGKPDVLSATNGGNGSSGVMNLGNGDGTFSMGTPVSGLPLAVADFNGDGIPDVLEQGTGTLLVLLGNGDGTFQAPISTASGANLTNIAAADLNGDSKADVVGIFNGALLVYMGKGNGTFSPGVSYSLGTTSSANVTFGDFNGDNITDIAVVINNIDLPGSVLVFLGNGDGTFQSPKTSPAMYSAGFAAAGDFNGDGKLDLVASGSTAPANNSALGVFLLLGNGDGTFQAPTEIIPVGAEVAAADVNGDGKLDLILEGGAAQIYLGNGDGTFYLASSYVLSWTSTAGDQNSRSIRKPGTIPTPGSIVIADFNLDGKPDIATGGSDLLGNGDGTFQGIWLGLATYAQSTLGPEVVGDFEKKGAQDVAQLSSAQSGNTLVYTLYILSNNGAGTLSLIHTYTLPGPANDIVTADFNGDGNLDLVVAGSLGFSSGNWSYTVLLGNGDGSFQTPVFYQQNVASVIGPGSITVADFNKDHYLDLVIGAGNQSLAVLLGKGDGPFPRLTTFSITMMVSKLRSC